MAMPLCYVSTHVIAQPSYCEPELLADSGTGSTAYRYRDNRCEGSYKPKINSTKLVPVSLTERFDVDPKRDGELAIRWPKPKSLGPEANNIKLRARSLDIGRKETFYRMDSEVSSADGVLVWPSDVLGMLNLEKVDLGVLGWTRAEIPDVGVDLVYLPLRVTPENQRPSADRSDYELVLMPSIKLREVTLTLVAAGSTEPLISDLELGYGYYPLGHPVHIDIERPEQPGLYRVEVSGIPDRDASKIVSSHLWLYSD